MLVTNSFAWLLNLKTRIFRCVASVTHFFILGDLVSKSFVEERSKLFEERLKKFPLQDDFFEEGLIGEYKRLVHEHRKTNIVKTYKKIKICRKRIVK